MISNQDWTSEEIKGKILHKLSRFGKFEHSHTAIENLQRGFPSHLQGRVKDNIKELKREGALISKSTSYGEQVSVNLEMKERIIYYIGIFLDRKELN